MKKIVLMASLVMMLTSCSIYKKYSRPEEIKTDNLYGNIEKADTTTMADVSWRNFFTDKHLQGYIEQDNGIEWALMAYNGGPSMAGTPATQEYARWVIARADELRR